jgi:hypothetical protein
MIVVGPLLQCDSYKGMTSYAEISATGGRLELRRFMKRIGVRQPRKELAGWLSSRKRLAAVRAGALEVPQPAVLETFLIGARKDLKI